MSKDNGALWAKITSSMKAEAENVGAGVTNNGVDAYATITKSQSTFAKNPFAIDCRSWAWNNVRAALNKGVNKEACQTACEDKYK